MSTFSKFTRKEWCILLLTSLSSGFAFSITTIGIPILPQYFRDAGVYKLQNVTDANGFVAKFLIFLVPLGQPFHKATKTNQL